MDEAFRGQVHLYVLNFMKLLCEKGALRELPGCARAYRLRYNEAHGIVPQTIVKSVRDLIEISKSTAEVRRKDGVKMTQVEREREIARLEKEMRQAARMMEFEYAAVLRDQIIKLRGN